MSVGVSEAAVLCLHRAGQAFAESAGLCQHEGCVYHRQPNSRVCDDSCVCTYLPIDCARTGPTKENTRFPTT